MSSLLAHLGQSYQTVADRYLYRDADDAPTDLTFAFSHIREVRLTQSLEAIRELLKKARHEPIIISNFNPEKYASLINSCQFLLSKIIEATPSYFLELNASVPASFLINMVLFSYLQNDFSDASESCSLQGRDI